MIWSTIVTQRINLKVEKSRPLARATCTHKNTNELRSYVTRISWIETV